MAITQTLRDSGSGSSVSSKVTNSVTLTVGSVFYCSVSQVDTVNTPPQVPTIAGWTLVTSYYGGGLWERINILRKVGDGSSGTLTIDFAGQTQSQMYYAITEVTGLNTTTPEVAGSAKTASGQSATASLTFNSPASAENAHLFATVSGSSTSTNTPEGGWTPIAEQDSGLANYSFIFRVGGGDLTPSVAYNTTTDWLCCGIELAAPTVLVGITRYGRIDTVQRASAASATKVEETNYTITWAQLTGAGFANADDVIILCRQSIGGASAAGTAGRGDWRKGSTFAGATLLEGSDYTIEPQSTTSILAHHHSWFIRVTLATNDNIYFGHAGDGTNVGYSRDMSILILKLGDLTADDFKYAEVLTNVTTAPTSYDTNGAVVTVPGRASDNDWLLLAMTQFLVDTITIDVAMALSFGGADYGELLEETEDVAEIRSYVAARYVTGVTSNQTLQARYRCETTTGADIACTRVFALRLSRFRDHNGHQNDAPGVTHSVLDTYQEVAGIPSYSHGGSGANDLLAFAYTKSGVSGDAAKSPYGRLQIGGADVLSSLGRNGGARGHGTADLLPWFILGINSQSNGTLDVDLDMAEDSDVSPTYTTAYATLVLFSAELLSGSVTLVVADVAVGVGAEAPALTQKALLTMADATVGIGAEAPTLLPEYTLVVNDGLVGILAESPSLLPRTTLIVADMLAMVTSETPNLLQRSLVAVADALVAIGADAPSLLPKNTLTVADALIVIAADAPALTQKQLLAVADALIAIAAETPTLTVSGPVTLSVADALVAIAAESPTLLQAYLLNVADGLVALSAEQPSLTPAYLLAIADALVGVPAQNVTLNVSTNLTVADGLVVVGAESPALVQAHLLVITDALVAASAEQATLSPEYLLTVADALVAVAAESPAVTERVLLSIADALVAVAAESPTVTSAYLLVVADALLVVAAESPTVVPSVPGAGPTDGMTLPRWVI